MKPIVIALMRRIATIAISLIVALSTATPIALVDAQALPITFSFEGTVTCSDVGTIPIGSAVTGYYTFDNGLIDTEPNPFNGIYGPVDLTITFLDGSSIITSTATFFINNNSSGFGTTDEYSLRMDTAPDTLTGSFAGLTWEFGRLHRFDDTGTALPDDSLPLTPPDLASLPGQPSPQFPLHLWLVKPSLSRHASTVAGIR